MTRTKWCRLSLECLQERMAQRGHSLDPKTIRRLLLSLKYSLKGNRKRFTGPPHPERDRQFRCIARWKKRFAEADQPIISVDTKKKELIGNFKNPGKSWCEKPVEVNAYDFLTDALGRASPYGIYLPKLDRGYVYVGLSRDTPEFAVTAISKWWREHGSPRYPQATRLRDNPAASRPVSRLNVLASRLTPHEWRRRFTF